MHTYAKRNWRILVSQQKQLVVRRWTKKDEQSTRCRIIMPVWSHLESRSPQSRCQWYIWYTISSLSQALSHHPYPGSDSWLYLLVIDWAELNIILIVSPSYYYTPWPAPFFIKNNHQIGILSSSNATQMRLRKVEDSEVLVSKLYIKTGFDSSSTVII